ncbi:MAG: DNA polymerase III subunit beta [Pseudomonadota bacterium]
MTIELTRSDFDKAINYTMGAVGKSGIPVINGIAMSANGKATFTSSDLDTYLTAEVDYEGEASDGFVILAPGKVRDAVREGGGDTVTFGPSKDTRFPVSTGALTINGRSLPIDDMPTNRLTDTLFQAELGSSFFDALARVKGAISTEETRYYLNGVYMHKVGDWQYRLVTTDGHRLYIADVPLPDAQGEWTSAIIPRRAVALAIQHFSKSQEPVKLTFGRPAKSNKPSLDLASTDGATHFALDCQRARIRQRLTSKTIDGTYPDYTRVVPTANDKVAVFASAELERAVRSVGSLGGKKTRAVKIAFGDHQALLSVMSPENGDATITIDCRFDSRPFEIGFNAAYLLDAIAACGGEEIRLTLADASAPTLIENPADTAFRAILMPMRV